MFGGKHHLKFDINACIDTSFVKSIGKEIADKVLPGIGKVQEQLAKAKEYFKNIGKGYSFQKTILWKQESL